MAANQLTRKSTGLTEAHKGLLRMLAQMAVEAYVRDPQGSHVADTAHRDQAAARQRHAPQKEQKR